MALLPAYARPPTVALHAMAATSQAAATRAALRVLDHGGNAADAAIAAAAVLCVTEPMSTGIGGDMFALIWQDGKAQALDAAGPAPASAVPEPVAPEGPTSVTVPGAVGGWAALAERYGRWGLDTCLNDAIDIGERGFAVGHHCARMWREATRPVETLPRAPRPGDRVAMPALARSLRAIGASGPDAFYRGEVAASIASVTWLEESDLADYAPAWVEPLRLPYRDVEVLELPPPTQGVAALEALGLLQELSGGFAGQVQATRLSLADAFANVRDGSAVDDLLTPAFLRRRSREAAVPVDDIGGGTVYLCVVDEDGMAVSFIQSLFEHFGSGIVAPGTGIVLNNRGACFSIQGEVTPGRRPFHTLIPGMLLRDGELLGPFGVMGGFIQAQAHVQLVAALVDQGLDAQTALDLPRFRIDGDSVRLERGLWDQAGEVDALGLRPVLDEGITAFGGGQVIVRENGALAGGSDWRKDGYAAGY